MSVAADEEESSIGEAEVNFISNVEEEREFGVKETFLTYHRKRR